MVTGIKIAVQYLQYWIVNNCNEVKKLIVLTDFVLLILPSNCLPSKTVNFKIWKKIDFNDFLFFVECISRKR